MQLTCRSSIFLCRRRRGTNLKLGTSFGPTFKGPLSFLSHAVPLQQTFDCPLRTCCCRFLFRYFCCEHRFSCVNRPNECVVLKNKHKYKFCNNFKDYILVTGDGKIIQPLFCHTAFSELITLSNNHPKSQFRKIAVYLLRQKEIKSKIVLKNHYFSKTLFRKISVTCHHFINYL